jgi:multisubunit Na+/H+ antiporter MnhC subunit/multisubunit Na+/H+ antiporter MnhB subunit
VTPVSALDLLLGASLLAVAGMTIAARDAFAAAVSFVAFGLLLALVWVRIAAPDVALTEAAIGSGLTGGLLVAASSRLPRGAPSAEPGVILRLAAAAGCVLVTAGLAATVLSLPEPAPTLAPLAAAHLPQTGLGNPVTAVLMAYRAIDTLLEVVVLLLAVIGVWSLAPDRFWRGRPGLPQREDPDGVLVFFARLLPPLGVLVAIHLFWIGSDAPGRGVSERYRARRHVDPGDDGRAGRRAAERTAPAAAPAGRRTGRFSHRRLRRSGDSRKLPWLSAGPRQADDRYDRGAGDFVGRGGACPAGGRSAGTDAGSTAPAMSGATLFGLCAAVLVGLGVFGLIVDPQPLRKVLAFNLIGSGAFVAFGIVARRGAAAGIAGDPIPQALVITGIVVAFAATALAVALLLRLFEESGRVSLRSDAPGAPRADDAQS